MKVKKIEKKKVAKVIEEDDNTYNDNKDYDEEVQEESHEESNEDEEEEDQDYLSLQNNDVYQIVMHPLKL